MLFPDIRLDGPPDVERAALGNGYAVHAERPGTIAEIPSEHWRDAVAMVCYHDVTVTSDLLKRMPDCRVVVRAGVGYDNIDTAAAAALGIGVCNTPDHGTTDVADHAIAPMSALLHGVTAYNRRIFEHAEKGWPFDDRRSPTTHRDSRTSADGDAPASVVRL